MRPTLVYKKPVRIAANFKPHINYTVYTPQKIHGLFYTVRKFKLIRCHTIYNNNHFVNSQVVIDGLDRMGWYVDQLLCLGDVSKETLNSYTGCLIYHSSSHTASMSDKGSVIPVLVCIYFISVTSLLVWRHVTISRDDHQLIECSPIGQKCQKMNNCESISIPLLDPRSNSDSLLIFCCEKLHSTFPSCFAVKVGLSLSWYQKLA